MADYHVLTGSNRSVRVAMHFPTPVGNNEVGVLWSTALLNSGVGGTTVLRDSTTGDPTTAGPGEISDNNKTAIEAGLLYELVAMLKLNGDETNAQKVAAVESLYTRHQSTATGRIADQLRYFGFSGDVT